MKKPQIAAYYFPNFHQDKRNAAIHGAGWTEWELVRQARPRFPNHNQPLVPLWGYEDESDPNVMRRKIKTAHQFGIDAFIFDWYYYEDGMFLEEALEKGFMPASLGTDFKFALMWANHNWCNIHPWTPGTPKSILYPGQLTDQTFDKMCDYIIRHYFKHPNYWKINGCPYFSIYLTDTSILQRLELLRHKVRVAGFPDVHLNMIFQEEAILPGENGMKNKEKLIQSGTFNSLTSYVWVHHCIFPHFPVSSYKEMMDEYFKFYKENKARYQLPYYPNVTMGWDSSPRTDQSSAFKEYGYPYTSIMPSTPELFHEAMNTALAENSDIITINAWNEWTEGSYLEPDTIHKTAFLEALRKSLPADKTNIHQ
ncbi:MAG: glycoside hydrolase family 99-like domain-containing protein [Lentisphaeria bacterium]